MTTTSRPWLIPTQAVPGLSLLLPRAEAGLTVSFPCAKARSAAGSRTQMTSGHSAQTQLSSPLRPGSLCPYPGEVILGPVSPPETPVPAALHYSERVW